MDSGPVVLLLIVIIVQGLAICGLVGFLVYLMTRQNRPEVVQLSPPQPSLNEILDEKNAEGPVIANYWAGNPNIPGIRPQ